MVLASAFTWSVYSLVNKKITFSYPPLMTILYLIHNNGGDINTI